MSTGKKKRLMRNYPVAEEYFRARRKGNQCPWLARYAATRGASSCSAFESLSSLSHSGLPVGRRVYTGEPRRVLGRHARDGLSNLVETVTSCKSGTAGPGPGSILYNRPHLN